MSDPQHVDLAIRNGTVVTASSRYDADVGIRDGQIVQIGGTMTAAKEIDATDRLVLPGGIDMHVHLTGVELPEGGELHWADDFASGTRAAAAGGITTVGNITFPRPNEGLEAVIERTAAEVGPLAYVDYALHPVILDPAHASPEALKRLIDAGHSSIKIFMVLGNFDNRARDYLDVMRAAGELGMLTLVHCEDGCIVGHITERLLAAGNSGPEWYGASRPIFSEEVAAVRAIGFAEAAEAPIYVVHLSSQAALEACHRARARHVPVYVETRPLYLYFNLRPPQRTRRRQIHRPTTPPRGIRRPRPLERSLGRRHPDLLHRPRPLETRRETRPLTHHR